MRHDFICNTCTEVFEAERAVGDRMPVTCPVCKSGDTTKIFLSVPTISFKWWNALAAGGASELRPRSLRSVRNKKAEEHLAEVEEGL